MDERLVMCLVYTVLGYLSGGMLYAYLLPKLLRGIDVREGTDDGNPGGFNAIQACGLPLGILCIALDILKGTVPVLLAIHLGGLQGWYLVPAVLAPVAGHAWPLLLRGRGGKCISVSFGVFIGLLPEVLLGVFWAVFYLALLPVIHDHRVLTRVSSLMMLVMAFLVYPMAYVRAIACGVTGILHIKHRPKGNAETEQLRAA